MAKYLNIVSGKAKSSIPQDSEVFVNANGINKTLYQAIVDGQIGGATATDYNSGTNTSMEAATPADGARWWNTDYKMEFMYVDGRWILFGLPDPRYGGLKQDDFDGNTAAGWLNWTSTGTSASIAGEANYPGIIRINQTAAASRSAISLRSNSILLGNQNMYFEFVVRVPTLATATEDFVCTFGLNDNNASDTNGFAIDGVYFAYNRASGGNFWQTVTSSNSTRTITTTTSAVAANTWYRLGVRIYPGTVKFYVGATLVATHTTNIPTGTGRETGFQVKTDKTATAASVNLGCDVDYFYNWYAIGSSRA